MRWREEYDLVRYNFAHPLHGGSHDVVDAVWVKERAPAFLIVNEDKFDRPFGRRKGVCIAF